MHKIKTIFQKLRSWYHGQTDYSIGRKIGQDYNRKRGIKSQTISPVFSPPLIARILNPICRFWGRHWNWIIGLTVPSIISIIGLYLLWLQLTIPK